MEIETKKLRKREVDDYLKFGWQVSGEERRSHRGGATVYTIVARDKTMQNYALICALESKYFFLKNQIRTYEPADPAIIFILLLLFIFPCIIYLLYKSNQKEKINDKNNELDVEMFKLANEAKRLF